MFTISSRPPPPPHPPPSLSLLPLLLFPLPLPPPGSACLEVSLNHTLLKDGGQVIVSPSFFASTYNNPSRVQYEFSKCTSNLTPIVFYTVVEEPLAEKDLVELRVIKTLLPNSPVFFLRIPQPPTTGWFVCLALSSYILVSICLSARLYDPVYLSVRLSLVL